MHSGKDGKKAPGRASDFFPRKRKWEEMGTGWEDGNRALFNKLRTFFPLFPLFPRKKTRRRNMSKRKVQDRAETLKSFGVTTLLKLVALEADKNHDGQFTIIVQGGPHSVCARRLRLEAFRLTTR